MGLARLILAATPAELRGTAFGMFNPIAGLALLAASVIAGPLGDPAGQEAIFLARAAFSLLTLIASLPVRAHLSGMRE